MEISSYAATEIESSDSIGGLCSFFGTGTEKVTSIGTAWESVMNPFRHVIYIYPLAFIAFDAMLYFLLPCLFYHLFKCSR